MTARRVLVLLFVSLALGGLSCSREFVQAVVPPEEVPKAIRQAEEFGGEDLPQPVWRACYAQDGYEIAVSSYLDAHAGGHSWTWRWFVLRGGQPIDSAPWYPSLVIQTSDTPKHYGWLPEEHVDHSLDVDEVRLTISAVGWALDRAAYRVVGTTTQGSEFEGRVVNGYWILIAPVVEGVDRFETVAVQDVGGKILHRYDRSAVVQ